jgi:hypothetical protein
MNRILLWAAAVLVATAAAFAQEPGTPKGLESERNLPSRHPYVVQDMLKYCQPTKGFWIDLGAGHGDVAIPLIERVRRKTDP